jgi:hypothetical protein
MKLLISLIGIGIISFLVLPPRCKKCGGKLRTYTYGKPKIYCETPGCPGA